MNTTKTAIDALTEIAMCTYDAMTCAHKAQKALQAIAAFAPTVQEAAQGELITELARLALALDKEGYTANAATVRTAIGALGIAQRAAVAEDERYRQGYSAGWRDASEQASQPEAVADVASDAVLTQARYALEVAMQICDAIPTRLQNSADSQLAHIGMLVNARPDGHHGYAIIRDALIALRTATPDILFQAAAQTASTPPAPAEKGETLTRFCPGCGSVGEVDTAFRDCCPDGSDARLIPKALAGQCRSLFLAALKSVAASHIKAMTEQQRKDAARTSDWCPHCGQGWDCAEREHALRIAALDAAPAPSEPAPQDMTEQEARAALAAMPANESAALVKGVPASQGVPEGFILLPKEADRNMVDAAMAVDAEGEDDAIEAYRILYRAFRDAAPAPAATGGGEAVSIVTALKGEVPLVEPVYIGKALRAGRQARAELSGGIGPVAAVHLVNIGLTGWIYTKETAEAYANGYNDGVKHLRHAVLEVADLAPQSLPASDASVRDWCPECHARESTADMEAVSVRRQALEEALNACGDVSDEAEREHDAAEEAGARRCIRAISALISKEGT